ncbi:MAG: hypothetical protein LPK12_17505 [Rhodobacterales bacterium]|nr:hypothetical protein [Rhodobacterales bacterium]MDX5501743.1 hypothetical protein [Rhodobacterales bacterium]
MTTTVDTLVNFFTGQGAFDGLGVQQMKDWYEWRGLDYEETVRLKERWVQQWHKASAEAPPKEAGFGQNWPAQSLASGAGCGGTGKPH